MKTLCSATALAALLLAGCAGRPETPTTPPPAPAPEAAAPLPSLRPGDALLIAAGDIAACNEDDGAQAKATAAVIAGFPKATVIAAGDLAYKNGTESEFSECYDRVWGAHKERTRPAPGNHDYGPYASVYRNTAKPYFDYFGANAGPKGKGYYSFDLGAWHIVSLNSMADVLASAPTMAEQVDWLKTDLAANRKPCILAYWHHPLFTSGEHGDEPNDPGKSTKPLWDVLYSHGADVIVNGHDHDFERFAPQTPIGAADPKGIREFVVGTGGIKLRGPGSKAANNTENFLSDNRIDHGVLVLTLHPNSYEWNFRRVNGTDGDASTSAVACHP
ncbi:MAG: metallophosphoesterase family protein [Thermoanaerobaculia bacterium]